MHEAMANSSDFEIHRIVLDASVKKELTFTDKGAVFHVLPRTKKTIGLYTRYIWDRWQVSRCLKKIKPDLVHAWVLKIATVYAVVTSKVRRFFLHRDYCAPMLNEQKLPSSKLNKVNMKNKYLIRMISLRLSRNGQKIECLS